jgi:hypothetical protein
METGNLHSVDNPIHSKLTQFPEKAGKTRTIAVIDYYSQRCLHPLHKGLMTLLSNLVSDGTYSHNSVGKFAAQKTKEKSFIACADLTAATDRFPAEIQEALLHALLKDSDLTNSLWTLLAKRTFTVAWSGEQVEYQCGQPMGAHASWPLFTLAHHLVVEYAAHKRGVPNAKAKYRLIGDDVIISDEAIWSSYREIMLDLGLTINLGKTVISPRSSTNSSAEVAKQLYLNGRCLSPLTPGFVRDLRKPYMFNTCMGTLRDRYGERCPVPYSTLIKDLFPKERIQKLVGMLLTNPVTGILKPGKPGYEELSPWTVDLSTKAVSEYRKIYAQNFISKATDCTTKQLFHVLSGGSPWNDSTRPQPKSLRRVYKTTMYALRDVLNEVKDSFFNDDLDSLMEVASYVPNPDVPYMERKDLIQRRASSSIVELYNSISRQDGPTDCISTALPFLELSGASLVAMPIRPLS